MRGKDSGDEIHEPPQENEQKKKNKNKNNNKIEMFSVICCEAGFIGGRVYCWNVVQYIFYSDHHNKQQIGQNDVYIKMKRYILGLISFGTHTHIDFGCVNRSFDDTTTHKMHTILKKFPRIRLQVFGRFFSPKARIFCCFCVVKTISDA